MRVVGLWMHFLCACFPLFAQVDTTYIYNTSTPYGTLDLRIAKSATRYYYLQEDKTFSFRESSPGVKTNTYRDMTSWDSSPYRQGNLREKNGSQDLFIMNYRFLMPKNYNPDYDPGYPIILMLHGYGERGNCWDNSCYWSTPSWNPNTNSPPAPTDPNHSLLNNDHNLLHGGLKHLNAVNLAGGKLPDDPTLHPQAFPGFVLFPQCLNGWHQSARVEEAIKLLRLIIKKYNIDPNRVYIHALSNGGGGLYQAIKRAPWLFAAALPMSAVSHSGAIDPGVIDEVAKVPLWAFQGAKDLAPSPTMTYDIIKTLRGAGAEVRYTLYPHLGHGTWNAAYNEPDFFSWILSKRKNNPHVRYERAAICATNGEGAHFSFSKGFAAYQWEKDGELLTNETSAEYVATGTGVVRGRFSRKKNPSESDWEPWSDPVEVTEIAPAKAVITPLGSTHLRGPGLSSSTQNNTVILRSDQTAELYNWYRNGTPIDFQGTTIQDTLRTTTFISSNAGLNGSYTLVTSNAYCPSPPSGPMQLFFANSAPQNMTLDQESTQFKGVVVGDGVFLTWNDVLTVEGGYEIWRRRNPSSPFEFAGRTGKDAISLYDTPLEPQTTYQYKFRAISNSGVSNYLPSNNLDVNFEITTGDDNKPPSAPQDLKMILNTIHSFTLSWTPSTDNTGIREYIVHYGNQSVSTGSNVNTFTIDHLVANHEFAVTVQGIDHGGNISPHSNQIIATTYMLGLNYKHSTGGWEDLDAPSMIATWADPEFQGHVDNITLAPRTQEDFFNFQFTGYLDIVAAGEYQFSLRSDDGSRFILDNAIVIDNDGLHGPRTVLSDTVQLSAGAHPIEIQYFEYSGGNQLVLMMKGPDDLTGPFVPIPDSLFRSAPYTADSPPPVPTGLSATAAGMTRIDLSWQSSSLVEIYRATASKGVYHVIGTSESGNFSDAIGLTPSTTYYYKVKAINNAGTSGLTGAVSATTHSDNVAPSVPAGLQLQTLSQTHVSITWTPATDNVAVVQYRVYANNELVETTTVAAAMIEGLTPNTGYVIEVTAIDANENESAKSEGLQFQTECPPLDVDGPEVAAEDVCADDSATIKVGNTQATVNYVAVNGQGSPISPMVQGGPEEITLILDAADLQAGSNHVRILAGYEGCTTEYLTDVVDFDYTPQFTVDVEDAVSVCIGDQAVIHASGMENGSYRWFDQDQEVIDSVHGPTLVTPPVSQEAVYYVAGVQENGCQSPLESIHIVPDNLEVPVITNTNDTLFAQSDGKLQWKKDGSLIDGATQAYYVPESSGVYSVIAIKGGCVRESADFIFTLCIIDPSGPQVSAENLCEEGPAMIVVSNSQNGVDYLVIDENLDAISDAVAGNSAAIELSVAMSELDSGRNELRVMARQEGCSDEVLESVAVFDFIPLTPPIISEANGILFTDSIGHLQWKRGGEPIPDAHDARLIPLESGEYTVEVEVAECRVESLPFDYVLTAIGEDFDLMLSVFPVPGASTNMTIRLVSPETGHVLVRLLNLNGQVVFKRDFDYLLIKNGVGLFPSSQGLSDGLYLLIVSQGPREWRRRVFIRD